MLSVYVFIRCFFLTAQWNLVDDLHLLQFVSIPVLRVHIILSPIFVDVFEKGSIIR